MILVCAASGRIGSRVTNVLGAQGDASSVIYGARDTSPYDSATINCAGFRTVDYDDPAGMVKAFQGIERVLFIPSFADTEHRAQQMEQAIAAAVSAGVRQFVFIGIMDTRADSPLPFAHAYGRGEAALKASGLNWTILRTSMYTDNLAEQYPTWLERGELITCAGDGKISYVSRDDIARSAAGVLLAPIEEHSQRTYQLTGPSALSYADVADIVSDYFQTSITVTQVDEEEFARRLMDIWGVAYEGAEHVARVTSKFQIVFKEGLMSAVTKDVKQLSGKAPQDVRSWLDTNVERPH